MSVIVKGMEMPRSCAYCFAISESLDWCKLTDNEIFNPFPENGLPSFCPIRPLPEKHGRLIDADTAYDRIMEQEGGNLVDMDCVGMGLEECETIVEAEGADAT